MRIRELIEKLRELEQVAGNVFVENEDGVLVVDVVLGPNADGVEVAVLS